MVTPFKVLGIEYDESDQAITCYIVLPTYLSITQRRNTLLLLFSRTTCSRQGFLNPYAHDRLSIDVSEYVCAGDV